MVAEGEEIRLEDIDFMSLYRTPNVRALQAPDNNRPVNSFNHCIR
jgi:hypothetical protein